MPDAVEAALVGALIAAAVSVGIFATTQIIALVQRIRAARRARVEATLGALYAVILEARSPMIVRLWSKTEVRLFFAITEMVGALPRRDRPLVDFLWYTSQSISGKRAMRRVKIATEGVAAIRIWFGNRAEGRRYMTARLIAARQVSLFGFKSYSDKLPRGVRKPRRVHRPITAALER